MSWQLATTLIAGIGTLGIFSFLLGENRFYRLFEHLFIGIAAGLGVVLTIKSFLWPQILSPMFGYDIVTYPDGTTNQQYNPLLLLYLAPLFFGLFFYFSYSVRYGWLAKLAIGFTLGVSGGAAFKSFFNGTYPQIVGSFKPLLVFQEQELDIVASFSNSVFVLMLCAVMYYFFFSFRPRGQLAVAATRVGRISIMICCGAYFGSTVMARMALLVERVQFLMHDWWLALNETITWVI